MPLYGMFDALFKRLHIQHAAYMESQWDVIGSIARLQLFQEPEPLLGKGKWQVLRSRNRHQRRRFYPWLASQRLFDLPGQASHRGKLKQRAYRNFHQQKRAYARDDLNCQQRVAAQLKEIVMDTCALQAE